jgi:hypothetical protein
MNKYRIIGTFFVVAALLLAFAPASAAPDDTLGFTGICNNNAGDVAIGEAQLYVEVVDIGGGQVEFKFTNTGPEASSITDIYFDDGSLLGIAQVINGSGVDFTQGANPPNLPCDQNVVPPFETTAGFLADSDPPVQPNGVNPGEWVSIIFNLQSGKTFADVVSELNTEELRIGIHVQGFASGGSESFITGTPTAVTLASFGCKANRGTVTLTWVTGTEIDNAGFHLYRSTTESGARTRLTGTMLAAKGDATSGGSYTYTDKPGYGVYYYWLADVDLSGKTTLHGPVAVSVMPAFRAPSYRPTLPGSR